MSEDKDKETHIGFLKWLIQTVSNFSLGQATIVVSIGTLIYFYLLIYELKNDEKFVSRLLRVPDEGIIMWYGPCRLIVEEEAYFVLKIIDGSDRVNYLLENAGYTWLGLEVGDSVSIQNESVERLRERAKKGCAVLNELTIDSLKDDNERGD